MNITNVFATAKLSYNIQNLITDLRKPIINFALNLNVHPDVQKKIRKNNICNSKLIYNLCINYNLDPAIQADLADFALKRRFGSKKQIKISNNIICGLCKNKKLDYNVSLSILNEEYISEWYKHGLARTTENKRIHRDILSKYKFRKLKCSLPDNKNIDDDIFISLSKDKLCSVREGVLSSIIDRYDGSIDDDNILVDLAKNKLLCIRWYNSIFNIHRHGNVASENVQMAFIKNIPNSDIEEIVGRGLYLHPKVIRYVIGLKDLKILRAMIESGEYNEYVEKYVSKKDILALVYNIEKSDLMSLISKRYNQ